MTKRQNNSEREEEIQKQLAAFENGNRCEEEINLDSLYRYEINIRVLTSLLILKSFDKPDDGMITIEDFIDFVHQRSMEQKEIKLPPDYTRTVYSALMEEEKYKSEHEIIQEQELLGNSSPTNEKIRAYFEKHKHIYIPATPNELNNFNHTRYYYDLTADIAITKTNHQYSKLFAYKLLHFGLDEIDAFLEYQLEKHYHNNIKEFGRFLKVVLKAQKEKIKSDAANIINSWIYHKMLNQKQGQPVNQLIKKIDSTRKRQALIMYFIYKALELENVTKVADRARFLHSLLAWEISDINNSSLYQHLKEAPNATANKSFESHLLYVKQQFELLGFTKVISMIDHELQIIRSKK